MIKLPSTIYVATEPVNMHLSFDRLAGIVRDHLGGDPREEMVVVFHNRRRTHLKLLCTSSPISRRPMCDSRSCATSGYAKSSHVSMR